MAGFFDDEDVVKPASKSTFFDEQDVVRPVATQPAQQTTSFFEEKDVVSTPTPAPASDVVPTGFEGSLSDEDIQKVAQKYGVSAELLRDIAPFYRAKVQPRLTVKDIAQQSISAPLEKVSSSILMGIPQKTYQIAQSPEMQKAIDELRRIGDTQRSLGEEALDLASDIVMPGGVVNLASKRLPAKLISPARVAGAAATGAIYGATGAESGKEGTGALIGGTLGGALGGAGELLARRLKSTIAQNSAEKALAEQPEVVSPIIRMKDRITQESAESEKIIRDATFKGTLEIDDELAQRIVQQQESPSFLSDLKKEQSAVRKAYEQSLQEAQEKGKEIPPLDTNAVVREAAKDIVVGRVIRFAEEATGVKPTSFESAVNLIRTVASRQGQEAIEQKYNNWVTGLLTERAVARSGTVATDAATGAGQMLGKGLDGQFALARIDNKRSTDLERTLRDYNKLFNRASFPAKYFRTNIKGLRSLARKAKLDDEIVNNTRILEALEKPNFGGLTGKELEVAKAWREHFDNLLKFGNGEEIVVGGQKVRLDANVKPMSVPRTENYVPHMVASMEKIVPRIEQKMKQVQAGLGDRAITDLSKGEMWQMASKSQDLHDLLRTVSMFTDSAVEDGADLQRKLLGMLYTRGGNLDMEAKAQRLTQEQFEKWKEGQMKGPTKMRAALRREGNIPDFLREKNLYLLADKYASEMLKHVYLREPIDRFRYQARVLDKMKDYASRDYVNNLIADVTRVRQGTYKALAMDARIKLSQAVDKLAARTDNRAARVALEGVRAVPFMIESMMRQIYPNVLGWGVRAPNQNMTQLITKVAPELGTKYGYTAVSRAAAEFMLNPRQEYKRLLEKAQRLGNIPAEPVFGGDKAMAEGIRRSFPYRVSSTLVEGMTQFGMALYSLSESLNRALVVKVAEVMARDIQKGGKSAAKLALQRFPEPLQREIAANPRQMETLIAWHLNDRTMFNYNTASMSEYGRQLGPIFSTFSKWPTAQLGEAVELIERKGALKGGADLVARLLIPFGLLQAFDIGVLGEENFLTDLMGMQQEGLSDREKKAFGRYGLSQAAPVGSLGAIASGEIFTPPAIDAFNKVLVKPITTAEDVDSYIKGTASGLASTALTFGPGMGLNRLLFDDMITYVTGETPEGDNNLERILSGAEQLTPAPVSSTLRKISGKD